MILKTIRKTVKEYNLLEKKNKVLIAYSGGPDSSCLLALLLELRQELSLEIFLGHFNHKLRPRAEDDEKFVKNVAQKHSLPLFVGSRNVRAFAKRRKLNLEEAARKLRYDFLRKTAANIGANKIATGHTMTDQAETLLMRLMRGSGMQGLAGLYPMVEGMIIRPLIQLEREDIKLYLKKRGIPYQIDESNFDRRFLRNRIRMELIPYIRKNFEPKIVAQLGKVASILQEEEALLGKIAMEKAQSAILIKNRQICLDLDSLFSLPLALRRRTVRRFIHQLKGDLRGISFKDIESVLAMAKGKEYHMKKNLILCREGGLIFLKARNFRQAKYEYRWSGRKSLKIKEVNSIFEGKELGMEDFASLDFNDNVYAYLDLEKLRFPLLVRSRREGDRYRPLGSPGKKKLKEIMRAKHIPLSQRKSQPLFLSGKEIVWVLGLPVSEKYKISHQTKRIFVIRKL